jgi:hypothetical protein
MMYIGLQHPEIDWIESTGYPSWVQKYDDSEEEADDYEPGFDEDAAYEESRDRRCFGID